MGLSLRILSLILIFSATEVWAENVNPITYQGRILKPDGSPLNSTATFRFVIKSPNNCILWQEDKVIDMTYSKGAFSASIGLGINDQGGSHSFVDVFDNGKPINGVLGCDSGVNYTPGSSDDRKLFVSFNDGVTAQTVPPISIKSVPFSQFAGTATSVRTLLNKNLGTVAPSADGQVLRYNSVADRWEAGSVTAGVTSVALDLPTSVFSVGAAVSSVGTLSGTFINQAANTVFAGPNGAAGAPTFRALVAADVPSLDASKITSGTFSSAVIGSVNLGTTGVAAGSYGSAQTVSTFTVQTDGRLTVAGSVMISIDASQVSSGTFAIARIPDVDASKVVSGTFAAGRIPDLDAAKIISGTLDSARIPDLDAGKISSGTLAQARIGVVGNAAGGTGLDTSSAGAGQFLIGNGSGFSLGTLTAGNNISILNQNGTVTISSSNSGGTVTQVNTGTGLAGGPFTAVGTISLADTAVTAGGYGAANYSTTLTVDQQGRLTAAGSTLIAINGNQVTGGTINLAQIPDIDASKVVSGTLGLARVPDLDASKIVAGTLANARLPLSGVTAGAFSSSTYVPSFTVDAFGRLVSVGSNAISFPALQWTNVALGVNYASGSVGIGQATPATMLDVNGAIRIANDGTACAAGLAGAIRYNAGFVEYCNGSGPGWQTLGISGSGVQSLNGLTANAQIFAVGSTGTLAAFTSAGSLHTLNIPMASTAGAAGGLVTNADYLTLMNGTIPAGRVADLDSGKITSGTLANARLPVSGATAGNVGSSTYIPTLSIDAFGRITSYGSAAVSIPAAITSINGLTASGQIFVVGSSGTLAAFSSAGSTNTLNIPMASGAGVAGGLLSNADYLTLTNGTIPSGRIADLDASKITSGTLSVLRGGTGLDGSSAANGQLLIGNGSGYALGTLTAGTNITITNSAGGITIASSNSGGTVTQVNSGTGLTGGPINGVGTLSLANTAVTAGGYGNAAYSTTLTVDQQGRLTAAGSTLIAINGNQITSGTINLAQVPDLDAGKVVSGTFATARIPDLDAGKIVSGTLANARLPISGVAAGTFSSSTYVPSFTVDAFGRLVSVGSNAISFPALQWTNVALGVNYASGSVGIGQASPVTMLDVAGAIRIANDATACAAGLAGAIRYNAGFVEYCNGSGPGWQTLGISGAGIQSLNGLTGNSQLFAVGSAGTLAAFSSVGTLHTLNIPLASTAGAAGGLVSNADYLTLMNGTIPAGRVANLDASKITTGTLATAVLGVVPGANGGTVTQVNSGTGLTGGPISGVGTLSLSNTAVTPGGYGNAAYSTTLTVDQQGRLTAAGSTAIAINGNQITSGTVNLAQIPDLDAGKLVAGTLANARLPLSGATAGNVGSSTYIPTLSIDAFGRITSYGSAAISAPASISSINGLTAAGQLFVVGSSGTLAAFSSAGSTNTLNIPMASAAGVAGGLLSKIDYDSFAAGASLAANGTIPTSRGGTGLNGSAAANGQLLIGNGSGYSLGTLTAGSNITITNSAGGITIASTNSGGTVTQVNTGAGLVGGPISGVGTIALGTTGVVAGAFSSSTYVPSFTVDAYGRLVSVGSNAISFPALQWTNVALGVNYASGSVGIGQGSPVTMLDVAGAIRIANDATACAAGLAGAIRYNAGFVEYCNGSGPGWQTLGISGAGIQSLNGLTGNSQQFAVGSSGTLAAFSSAGTLHTLNIPLASTAGAAGGLLSNADYLTLTNGTIPAGRIANLDASKITTGTLATAVLGVVPGANGGTVTQVNSGTGLTGGPISGVGTLSLSNTAVTPGGYGNAAYSTTLTVDQQGRLTAAGSTAIAINGNQITSGTVNLAQIPDLDAGKLVAGTLANARLPVSGAVAGNVGSSTYIPTLTVDAFGRITSYGSAAISASASITSINGLTAPGQIFVVGTSGTLAAFSSAGSTNTLNIPMASAAGVAGGLLSKIDYDSFAAGASLAANGTIPVNRGGTGLNGSTAANGQLLIGNGAGYSLGTLISGSGITILNQSGSITISANNSGSVTQVNTGAGLVGGPITGVGTVSLGTTGVVASSVGSSGFIPQITFDAYGRITAVGSAAVAINASAISGTLGVDKGGTGLNASSAANGALLIGNGSGFTLGTLVASNGVLLSSGAGSVGISTNAQVSNTFNTLITRDGSGNFAAGQATLESLRLNNAGSQVTISNPAGSNYSILLPANIGSPGQVLSTDGTGSLSWVTAGAGLSYPLLSTTRGSVGTPVFSFSADSDTGIYSPGAGTIAISTNGTQRISINSAGRVGLGTASAATTLDVNGDAQVTGIVYLGSHIEVYTGDVRGGAGLLANGDIAMMNSGNFQWSSGTNYYAGIDTGFSRNAAGVVEFNNGTSGTLRDIRVRAINPTGGALGLGTTSVGSGNILEATGGAIAAGNNGELRMMEALTNGTNSVAFRAPAALAQNYSMTLPGTIGTSGQVLTTDGAGVLSWSTPGAGVTFPLLSTTFGSAGIAAYSFSGDADTGMYSPGAGQLAFTTNGTSRIQIGSDGKIGFGGAPDASVGYRFLATVNDEVMVIQNNSASDVSGIQFRDEGGNQRSIIGYSNALDRTILDMGGSQDFVITSQFVTQEKLRITNGGSVGIGVTVPTAKLDLQGPAWSGSDLQIARFGADVNTGDGMFLALENTDAVNRQTGIDFNSQGTRRWGIGSDRFSTGGHDFYIRDWVNATDRMYINSVGSIGVGNTSPAARLDVSGSIRGSSMALVGAGSANILPPTSGNYSLTLPTTPGTSGQVLSTAGTTGVLSWTSVPANGGTFLAASGSAGTPGFSFLADPNTGILNSYANSVGISVNGTERYTFDESVFYGSQARSFALSPYTPGSTNPTYAFLGDADTGLFSPGANTLAISTAGTTHLTVNNLGNVGIGTSTPGNRLDIQGGDLTVANSLDGAIYLGNAGMIKFYNGADILMLGAADNFRKIGLGNASTTTPALFIDTTANGAQIGMGTTIVSSGSRLEVTGGAITSGNGGEVRFMELLTNGTNTVGLRSPAALATSPSFFLPNNSGTVGHALGLTSSGSLGFMSVPANGGTFLAASGSAGTPGFSFSSDTDTGIFNPGANTLAFSTLGTTRMSILPNGYVGIGVTVPTSPLHIVAPSGGNTLRIRDTTGWSEILFEDNTGNSEGWVGTDGSNMTFASNAGNIRFLSGGTNEQMRMTNGGAFAIGTTAISTGSRLEVTGGAITSGNGGEVRFMELLTNGTNTVGLRAPAALATSPSFFLPNTSGTVGHALGLTSAGSLGFMSVPANGGTFLAASGSLGAPGFGFSSDSDTGMFSPGAGTIGFAINSNPSLTINGNGVGINNTNPNGALEVVLDPGVSAGFNGGGAPSLNVNRGNGNYSGIILGYWSDGVSDTDGAIATASDPTGLVFATRPSGSLVPQMKISQTGAIGMGTLSVGSGNRLEVTGGAIAAGNGGEIRWTELLSNGTNTIGFRAPANLSTSPSFFLPNTSGTVGHALGITSSGSLGFMTVPANGGTFLAASGSAGAPGFGFNSDIDTGLFNPGANTLAISTGGTARVYIDNAGNMSIGTPMMETGLLVANSNSNANITVITDAVGINIGSKLSLGGRYNGTTGDGNAANITQFAQVLTGKTNSTLGDDGGYLAFSTNPSGGTYLTERMRITDSGNIGMGTINVSTGSRLEVTGGAITSGNGGEVRWMELLSNGTNTIGFRAPANLATSPSFFLPNTSGTVGHALGLTSTGSLGFMTVPANGGTFLAASGSTGAPGFAFNSDTDTGLWHPGTNTLAISTAGTTQATITNYGHWGIGDPADPNIKLYVFKYTAGATGFHQGGQYYHYVDPSSASTGYYYGAQSVAAKGANANMTNSSLIGHLGIVEQGGTGVLGSAKGTEGMITKYGTGNITYAAGVSSYYESTATGTTTDYAAFTSSSYFTAGTITNGYGLYLSDMLASVGYGIYQQGANDFNYFQGTVGIGITQGNQTHILHINGQGRSTASAWATTSDIRLKDIQGQYQYGLNEILNLNTVWFRYKQKNPLNLPTDKVYPGVIAQELQAVIPEAVEMQADGYYTINSDPVHWAVINAIQELYQKWFTDSEKLHQKDKDLQQKIQSLEKENQDLKKRLEAIEERLAQ